MMNTLDDCDLLEKVVNTTNVQEHNDVTGVCLMCEPASHASHCASHASHASQVASHASQGASHEK